MEVKQLEIFSAVVSQRSFAGAAKQLGTSIPTVSKQISDLETELGCDLLTRSRRILTPTEKGTRLLERAETILRLCDETVREMRMPDTSAVEKLTIAASSIPAQYYLPNILAAYNQQHSRVTFTVHHMNSLQVVETVRKGQADIGLCGAQFERSGCQFALFAKDRLTLIAPNTAPYNEVQGNFPVELFLKSPFISREVGSGTRIETEYALHQAGIDLSRLNRIAEMGLTESIKKSVIEGLGVAIISERAVSEDAASGRLLSFQIDRVAMERNLYIVIRQNRQKHSPAYDFFQFVQENAALRTPRFPTE